MIGPLPPPQIGPAIGTQMISGAFRRSGARVLHVNTQDHRSVFNMGTLDLRNVALGILHATETAALAIRERPGVTYIPISQGRWGYVRDAVLMTILRLLRRPFVVHVRGSQFQEFYSAAHPSEKLLIRRTLKWAARAIVLTPNLTHLYDGIVPRSRVRVLENAIPDPYPDGIAPLAGARVERARSSRPTLRLLYLANDWRTKGALTLVRSLSFPGLEHVELHMAGAPREADLALARGVAADLGVADRIQVLGPISGEAKVAEFAWADALAHPTEGDGQPVVIIEAMAAGLPIVSTSYGGIPHTVGEGGLIVSPNAPEELARALRTLVDDPDARRALGDAARARFVAHYTPCPYQRRFVDVFSELLPLTPCAD